MSDEELTPKELEELEELAIQNGELEFQDKEVQKKVERDIEVQKKVERDINVEKVILTTAYLVSNREIDHEIEVITSECVYGMNVFRDFFAGARNFFGGRSDATQKVLNDLRETCLYELKALAYNKGADAVIAIDLDYSEFSGGMLFLVASGTAVKLK